jgi:hypothetical protein
VNAWIELQRTERETAQHDELFWSHEQMWELTRSKPDAALDVILTILRTDDSSTTSENLSAGPLEDLLAKHGPAVIERIEREAATNQSFRHFLGGVWKNAMTDEVWNRVQACWDRRGWDGIPE